MADRKSIKVVNAALAETPLEEIILRGVIDPDSLALLKVDEYQREILSRAKIDKLKKAMRASQVPDIELGMRGEHYFEKDGAFYLDRMTSTWWTDSSGGRRRSNFSSPTQTCASNSARSSTSGPPKRGKRVRFDDVNIGQTGLSGNVVLRNRRHTVPAVDALYRLSLDKGFVMSGQVSWKQTCVEAVT